MKPDDSPIESLLTRYRPMAPSPALRNRVVQSAGRRRSRWPLAGRLAIAALLALSLGLDLAAKRLIRETAVTLGAGQIEWTPEAREAAQMLNGNGASRRYLAIALHADKHRPKTSPQTPAPAISKGTR